ncbi:hypothetical protein ACLB2K_046640 [Fragaria x ananassa]
MAEPQADKPPTLAEQYSLEKPVVATNPDNAPKEVVPEEAPAAPEECPVVTPAAPEESPVVTPAREETSEVSPTVAETEAALASENSSEAAPEESSDSTETSVEQQDEAVEETPEIKIETAPADFRFPTTNQTRHCFTRYVEYHRCIAAKGEEAPECDKFKKYYRSLCPGEWVERWNEQRENGTFPGPL